MPLPSQIQGLDRISVEFHFEDESELLWHELYGTLLEFQHSYLACLSLCKDNLNLTLEDKMRWPKEYITASLRRAGYVNQMRAGGDYIFDEVINIERIKYESPLLICATCLAAPVVLAVVLSGGKIEIDLTSGKIKASLPPISKVLAELKKIFR